MSKITDKNLIFHWIDIKNFPRFFLLCQPALLKADKADQGSLFNRGKKPLGFFHPDTTKSVVDMCAQL